MTEKSSWLRRHKTSILLVCSGTRCSAYRENERTISLAVGAPWAQIWLCSPPIVTQNLIFSFLSNKQSNFLLILTYNENIRRMQHTLRATQEEEKKQNRFGLSFSLWAVRATDQHNVIHIILTSKGVSLQWDCEDANSVNGAWNCLLLLAWHSISYSWVYVLGFAVGPPIIALHAPAHILLPLLMPFPRNRTSIPA